MPERDTFLDIWERREPPFIAVLPYALLLVSAALTVTIKSGSASSLLPDLLLTLAAAGWILWMFTLHPAWRDRPGVMGVFFVVLVAITAALVIRDPWFGFFAFTLYFFAFMLPSGRWRVLGICVVAALVATSQNGGLPGPELSSWAIYVLLIAVNVAVAGGFVWFAWISMEQNERRRAAMAELREANAKLEATLAENAGLHEQLVAQAREAGILDERQRMAREIHDTLAQGLTGIITQLQAAEQAGLASNKSGAGLRNGLAPYREGSAAAADWQRHLEAATRLARESLTEARRSVQALRPESLETSRLGEALREVAERWSALNDVAVEVTATGPARPLPPEVELVLLRTAQEGLANVARHARATRVVLTLSYMSDQVTLDIRDDGVGFDAAAPPARAGDTTANGSSTAGRPDADGGTGFGLTAMRQRVEGLDGTLAIESAPGVGTAISAGVPLERA